MTTAATRDALPDCAECRTHCAATPDLAPALARVAVKLGETTRDTLRRYLGVYHRRGHPNDAAIGPARSST